ncbi:ABC transporter permease subunit [Psychrobacter sp. DAB_AL43B]|uniref:ABC transporter permease subunit n=1 Tax=Psychrobacter sp. DAB_AL43B TaxID=1028416 RepID=UPI0009A7F0FC|nr:ABC transporter permease subunit [Psychrobacter sp. DAB_AL43B]SLJ85289.1 iron(III) transport system permease protein [Psychrobacter sp. DAB_AL43B]
MKLSNPPLVKVIWLFVSILFIAFMFVPLVKMLALSFNVGDGLGLENYTSIISTDSFKQIMLNSFSVATISALSATLLAFVLAYTVHWTNLPKGFKQFIKLAALFPMLLPTVTYGFAIIYTFGKQGLLTQILGFQLFEEIYGFYGMWLGYTIYTLPIAFLLLNNTFQYLDKKFVIVSELMGDSHLRQFDMTVIRPLIGTFAAALIQCFFLAFTDFGIPASIGGQYNVIATELYTQILGASPSFEKGAVVALFMLIPSVLSIAILWYVARFNIRYDSVEHIDLPSSKIKDRVLAVISSVILASLLLVFAVIFIIPWIKSWPYQMEFSTEIVSKVLESANLMRVYKNSLLVAVLTAVFGTLITYFSALLYERSNLFKLGKFSIESSALVTNTVPGMVVGIAYLMVFSGSAVANTIFIIVISNIIHYFSTPYLMSKNALSKMNLGWETTAGLLGDSWFTSLRRIVIPNSFFTLIEVASFYFISAMVTISAVIFISGAKTMVLTTKIVELQHFARFDEIFILSLMILMTNICALILFAIIRHIHSKRFYGIKKITAETTVTATAA